MLIATLVLTIVNSILLLLTMAAVGAQGQKIDQAPQKIALLIADQLKKVLLGGRN